MLGTLDLVRASGVFLRGCFVESISTGGDDGNGRLRDLLFSWLPAINHNPLLAVYFSTKNEKHNLEYYTLVLRICLLLNTIPEMKP
jgi:hypothetical protein